MIKTINGIERDGKLYFNCRIFGGVYMYVDYVKGAETSYKLSFAVRDMKNLAGGFYNLIDDGALYEIELLTGKNVVSLPVPESADELEVTLTPTGTPDASTLVKIYVNGDIIGG